MQGLNLLKSMKSNKQLQKNCKENLRLSYSLWPLVQILDLNTEVLGLGKAYPKFELLLS